MEKRERRVEALAGSAAEVMIGYFILLHSFHLLVQNTSFHPEDRGSKFLGNGG
jgi:hypothetical protein